VQRSAVGGVDRGIGFLFGVLRGAVLIAVALVIYQRVVVSEPIPIVDESRSIAVFSEVTDAIDAQASVNAMNWLAQQYDQLIESCRSPGIEA
ncbi:MAG: CvpA family protein, partial [Boseongicola sp. SB0673_bin_14]|nr:CvpA family protein [Boseongicola sp. SB0673_bin_14]